MRHAHTSHINTYNSPMLELRSKINITMNNFDMFKKLWQLDECPLVMNNIKINAESQVAYTYAQHVYDKSISGRYIPPLNIIVL